MSKDRERQLIKRRILHFAQQKDYDHAIEECKRYLKIPGIVGREVIEIKKKMAEFYEKKGDKENMVREYIELADLYVREGFSPKAPPLLKKAIQYAEDKNKEEVLLKMAEIYERMGWRSEVIKCYSNLINIYAKRKEHYKAKEIYEKIIQLDPGNLENRVKYIEYLLHIGFKEEAKSAMEKLIDKLSEKENVSVILPIYEKMPSLFSLNHLKIVAQAYIAKGEYKKGVEVIKHYFEKGGRRDDPELFEMLYYGFSELGKKDKALLALKELKKIYTAQKNSLKLKRVYERILAIDPNNEEARAFLDKYKEPEEEKEKETVSSIVKPDELSLTLTKLEIFVKFDLPGYKEKAEELIKNIDILEIEEEAILKRLIHIFKKLDYPELLSLVYTQLAKVKEKNGAIDDARMYVNEALSVWAENPHALELRERLIPEEEEVVTEVEIEEVEKVSAEAESPSREEIEVMDGEYDLESVLKDEAFQEEISTTEEVVEEAGADVLEGVSEDRVEIELPGESEEIKVEVPQEEVIDRVIVEEPPSQEKSVVEEKEYSESDELSELVKEMEFFRSIGDSDSVREICEKILSIDPDHKLANSIMKELEGGKVDVGREDFEEIAKAMEEFEEEVGKREEVDEEEILKEVLEEFKKKVEETYSREDSATHYELGYAYMEMELWDEAIKEFEIALEDRSLRPQVYSLIARCYRMKGDLDRALSYYTELLKGSYFDEEGKAIIKKEMGEIFEKKMDYAQALRLYREALEGLSQNHPERSRIIEKINSLQGIAGGEEEKVAEVTDITTARKKKKKIYYM